MWTDVGAGQKSTFQRESHHTPKSWAGCKQHVEVRSGLAMARKIDTCSASEAGEADSW